MSLDLYFEGEEKTTQCHCGECGHPYKKTEREECFSANITHNLGKMADEAGIYYFLWRPEELGIKTASELIGPLEKGLALLQSDPERFEKFNSPNGWGMYQHFVPFVRSVLEAAKQYPHATVRASR
jgi:hypothetical protein